MPDRYAELTFTESVKRIQERQGTRVQGAQRAARDAGNDRLTEREMAFIAARDSFYLATVSETGWPYVQHRGGRPGFLRVLDPGTLAFADLRGNRQYQSAGNLAHDNRASLILMDYPNRRRLKLLGRVRALEPDDAPPDLVARLEAESRPAVVERVMLLSVEAWDWNCPQHITPRFTAAEMAPLLQPLRARITALEALLTRAGIPLPESDQPVPSHAKEKTE